MSMPSLAVAFLLWFGELLFPVADLAGALIVHHMVSDEKVCVQRGSPSHLSGGASPSLFC